MARISVRIHGNTIEHPGQSRMWIHLQDESNPEGYVLLGGRISLPEPQAPPKENPWHRLRRSQAPRRRP